MCRGKDHGGRRCPNHNNPQALAAHNRRRRDNRAIKAGIIAWAEHNDDIPADEVARLRQASPKAVKDWAKEHGLNPADFLNDASPEQHTPVAAAAPADRPHQPGGIPPSPAPHEESGGAGAPPQPAAADSTPSRPPWERENWNSPALAESIHAVLEAQGDDRDERALLDGQGTAIAMAGPQGTNETIRVELDNGRIGYHKAFDGLDDSIASRFGHDDSLQPIHEAAAWQLAKKMGPPWEDIVPPCVLREMNGRMGSFSLERPGRVGRRDFEGTRDWENAAFFDALIGQQDRHWGNYLIHNDRLTVIDHGYAFGRQGDVLNWSMLQNKRADKPLSEQEHAVLDRLIADPELFGMRKFLEPERAEALYQRAVSMKAKSVIPDAQESLGYREFGDSSW